MRTVVAGVHIAHAGGAVDDVIGLFRLRLVGYDALVGILDLIAAHAEHTAGGLLIVGRVGGVVVQEVHTAIQQDQGIVGLTALGHIVGIHIAACGGFQNLGGIAFTAHHEGAVAHQSNVPGAVLHVVDLVTGLIAAGFLGGQVLGVVEGVAAAVGALDQNADTGGHGQQVALAGVGTGHVEPLGGVGFFALHDPLIIAQLVAAFGGQNQQFDRFDGLTAIGFLVLLKVGLLTEIADHRAIRLVGLIGLGLQLCQDLVGAVGVIDGVHQSADGCKGNKCHENQEG